eukprot:1185318-Prorocentrum_minimum.AAC.7
MMILTPRLKEAYVVKQPNRGAGGCRDAPMTLLEGSHQSFRHLGFTSGFEVTYLRGEGLHHIMGSPKLKLHG